MILLRTRGQPQALNKLFDHLNAIQSSETVLIFFDDDEDPALYDAYATRFPDYVWQEPGGLIGINVPSAATREDCLSIAMRRFPGEPRYFSTQLSP